ncbi:unknown [Blautia hydrogenotrophica CAG:147]|nr:unknown [Blautia hydrogenotrophica CAG:147]
MLCQHGSIFCKAADRESQEAVRSFQRQGVTDLYAQLVFQAFCGYDFVVLNRIGSLGCLGHGKKLKEGFVKTAQNGLRAGNGVPHVEAVVCHSVPGDLLNFGACGQKLTFLLRESCEARMPLSIRLYGLVFFRSNLHVSHAEDDRDEKNCQKDAGPGHTALSSMHLFRNRNQIKIMFHFQASPDLSEYRQ